MPDPLYLATAVEIVLRAGDLQRAGQESGFRVDKKGSIDLVTEVDLACERMCRETLAERFPEHDILAEELGGSPTGPAASRFRWVFDPLDGTTNYAHGLPIYCSSLALEIDGRAEVAAIYDPTRKELFTAERGEGSYLNGRALRVSQTTTLIDSLLVTGFPYNARRERDLVASSAASSTGAGSAPVGAAAGPRTLRDASKVLGTAPETVGCGGRALIVEEAGGPVTGMDFAPARRRAAHSSRRTSRTEVVD